MAGLGCSLGYDSAFDPWPYDQHQAWVHELQGPRQDDFPPANRLRRQAQISSGRPPDAQKPRSQCDWPQALDNMQLLGVFVKLGDPATMSFFLGSPPKSWCSCWSTTKAICVKKRDFLQKDPRSRLPSLRKRFCPTPNARLVSLETGKPCSQIFRVTNIQVARRSRFGVI